jgi:hypothetical protein
MIVNFANGELTQSVKVLHKVQGHLEIYIQAYPRFRVSAYLDQRAVPNLPNKMIPCYNGCLEKGATNIFLYGDIILSISDPGKKIFIYDDIFPQPFSRDQSHSFGLC